MALNTSKCNHLTPLCFKGLISKDALQTIVDYLHQYCYFLLEQQINRDFLQAALYHCNI